ncbi:Putative acyl-CoA dehydrogenase/oxidase [Septoria linicola]|uniref:Acyl-CoA dehydrogenase/oxidase n=1 Tax=Septoria linicola TaxID=215465 RepID=A0A9Q9AVR2_9PEZI|nr:putative acyl-CoA dehydrogenase/oxidase [Septoria linicola]USW55764.1 Putative acyl-CoA dehydrogenase/oxidase [Septoria linicola]
MPIDFHLTESQREQQQDARNFATKVLGGAHATYHKLPAQSERFQAVRPFCRIATVGGLIKAQIPIALGGTNESLLDAAIALAEMYATDPSVTLTIAATGLGLTPLIMSGHERLQKECLKPFLEAGEEGEPLASLMHSEPQGTANWLEKGGLWTANSAGWDSRGADLSCLVCRTIPSPSTPQQDPLADPRESIIVFCLTRSTIASNPPSSYKILDEPELAGHPATSGPHTLFTNLRVPSSQILSRGPAAATLIEQSFAASAALVGSFSVSIMRSAFEHSLSFAKSDSRGGSVRIIEHQSVADILMDVKMRIDASRLLTWKALHALENGPGEEASRRELCLEVKIVGSEGAVRRVWLIV